MGERGKKKEEEEEEEERERRELEEGLDGVGRGMSGGIMGEAYRKHIGTL